MTIYRIRKKVPIEINGVQGWQYAYFDTWRFNYSNGRVTSVWGDNGSVFKSIENAKTDFYSPIMPLTTYAGEEFEIVSGVISDSEVVAKIIL